MPAASPPTASEQELRDAYRVLGVDPRASELAIKLRYRELVQIHHPDKWPQGSQEQSAATDRMRDINVAYDLIGDAPLRYAPAVEALDTTERTLEAYEAECRANQEVERMLNIDFEAGVKFIVGALVGCEVVRNLCLSGKITEHLWFWMVVGTLTTGLLFTRLRSSGAGFFRYFLL